MSKIKLKVFRPDDSLPIFAFIPNMLTLLGLCAGVTAIKFALFQKFSIAVVFVIIASVIDFFDGGIARLLRAQSKLGEQLDSFSDFINFGFVPAFIMYNWQLYEVRFAGWGCVLFAVSCMAIRLSKFNINESTNVSDPVRKYFFFGTPAPATGLMILGPLIASFEFPEIVTQVNVRFICVYISFICLMSISNVPTLSLKKIKVQRKYATPLMICFAILVIAFFFEIWKVLIGLWAIYILSWFYTGIRYRKMKMLSTKQALG